MRVVCINKGLCTELTNGKQYDVVHEVNIVNKDNVYYNLIDDSEQPGQYKAIRFITLEEYRLQKLKELF